MGGSRQTNQIEIDFSGEFRDIPGFNRKAVEKYIQEFIGKYCDDGEVFEVSVYLKKFESTYYGKPLVFCNFATNTTYGLVSASMVDWGLKKSVRGCLKSMILDVNKLAERDLYGEFAEVAV